MDFQNHASVPAPHWAGRGKLHCFPDPEDWFSPVVMVSCPYVSWPNDCRLSVLPVSTVLISLISYLFMDFIYQVPAILLSISLLLQTSHMTSVVERVWDERRLERIGSFPRVCTQETLHKNPIMYRSDGDVCHFQVEMAWKGGKSAVYLKICFTIRDAITHWCDYANKWCHLCWGESLICHSLSVPVVPAGSVAVSKRHCWELICWFVLMCLSKAFFNFCMEKDVYAVYFHQLLTVFI